MIVKITEEQALQLLNEVSIVVLDENEKIKTDAPQCLVDFRWVLMDSLSVGGFTDWAQSANG